MFKRKKYKITLEFDTFNSRNYYGIYEHIKGVNFWSNGYWEWKCSKHSMLEAEQWIHNYSVKDTNKKALFYDKAGKRLGNPRQFEKIVQEAAEQAVAPVGNGQGLGGQVADAQEYAYTVAWGDAAEGVAPLRPLHN